MPRRPDRHQSRDEDGGNDVDRLETVRRRFREFGAEYVSLPLYGAVSRHVADDAATASLLTEAQPGQARPVLWFAALHDLVLRRPDLPAARWYASVVGRGAVPSGDPWPDIRTTVLAHEDELRSTIATRTTQTNEVNRSVYVAAGLSAAVDALAAEQRRPHGSPGAAPGRVALVELGASAGLLLRVDRYRITTTSADGRQTSVGHRASGVDCAGLDRSVGRTALRPMPEVVGRVGVDRHPVALDDDDAVRWLLACLWPDVPGRVERFEAARQELLPDPPPVRAADLVDGAAGAVDDALRQADAAGGADLVVVHSSWALTYVEPERRVLLADELARVAAAVPRLAWLTAEPPACVPGLPEDPRARSGPTVLGLRSWSSGVEAPARVIGVAHPHGAWVDTW